MKKKKKVPCWHLEELDTRHRTPPEQIFWGSEGCVSQKQVVRAGCEEEV